MSNRMTQMNEYQLARFDNIEDANLALERITYHVEMLKRYYPEFRVLIEAIGISGYLMILSSAEELSCEELRIITYLADHNPAELMAGV